MIGSRQTLGTTVMLAGLTVALAAQAPKMNVKMGLWEMTSTMTMGGDVPGMPDTSKMTPEQQAQVKAAMASMQKPTTQKSCLTKEKFESGHMMGDDKRQNCTQTVVANTATAYDMKVECNQNGTVSSGTMHFEAPTPGTVKGKMLMQSTGQGKTMTMNVTTTGKWLGADCGDVK